MKDDELRDIFVRCTENASNRTLEDAAIDAMRTVRAAERARAGFLSVLRRINVDRCTTAFKHTLNDWTVMEWGCAIGGEAGELQNALKKIRREEQNIAGSRLENPVQFVADEIADIIIYCDLLAARMGIDLQKAITDKFNETSRKMGFSTIIERGDGEATAPASNSLITG